MVAQKRSILLVDDDHQLVAVLKVFLELEGFTVRAAANGAIALRALAQHECDLVVTDLVMPGMGGLELVDKLRQQGLHEPRPVILITAETLPSDARTDAFDAVLRKPFSVLELRDVVSRVLARPANTTY